MDFFKNYKNKFLLFVLLNATALGGFYFIKEPSLKKASSTKDLISKTLEEMSSDEKWLLDFFFRDLLLKESGAFVLHGSKPVGLTSWLGPKYYLPTIHWRGYRKSALIKKGYEVWKKYQHVFQLINYCICYRECEEDEYGEDWFDVFLINKNTFLKVVAENIEEFKSVFGSEVTPEILLEKFKDEENLLYRARSGCVNFDSARHSQIEAERSEGARPLLDSKASEEDRFGKVAASQNSHNLTGRGIYETLDKHAGLLGIILGYGKHNSWLFYRREVLRKVFTPKKLDIIKEGIDEISKKLSSNNYKRSHLIFSSLPVFVFDSVHPETRELNARYNQQRKEFTDLYKNGNFLEVSLRLLTHCSNI